ncbi:MAG TPA: alkaline phosphatase family protein [Thermoanaerobaculia bacterium]|jgi:Tfp pilus assembly protein PilF|nr:alkaline phosphatase family protein [Thermoanaerobaculia bacterium]
MRRSRLPLVLLLAALACRRTPEPAPKAADLRVPAAVPEIARAVHDGRRVLFVGLDGADWQLLDGYMQSGRMPNLAALAKEGRTAVLTTIHPPLSPIVWTTMMTGTSPLDHGVLDFTRRNPETGDLEPITSGERRVPAIWNLATEAGKSVAIFGLWATWPAEPVRGLLVADRLSSFTAGNHQPPPGVVYPPAQEAWARETLAKADREVDYEALRAYLPWLGREEYERWKAAPDPYAHPVSALRRILVETRAYHALATSWLAREKPDLAVVYFQGTDTLGHVFAPYAPPRQATVSAEDFQRFSQVPELYFAEVDRLLGDYRKLAAASGAVLMIASDHGFHWQEGRPARISSAAAATAGRWHRDEGIYLVAGPGVPASDVRGQGNVIQVCGTLMNLLGMPPSGGVAGPPLTGVEVSPDVLVNYRDHWRPAAPARQVDSKTNQEEIEKLRSLGYVGASGGTVADGSTRTAASYDNEGLLRRERGETEAAAAAFEHALALEPASAAALWNLSDLLHSQHRDLDRSDDLLVRALAAGLPDGVDYTAGRAVLYAKGGEAERALRLLDRALQAQPADPRLHLLRGRYHMERRQCREALADFDAATAEPKSALAQASAGLARLCLGDSAGAARNFRKSLEIDPNQPEIRRALGQVGGS